MRHSAILEAGANIALALVLLWPVHQRLIEIAAAIPRRYTLFCLTSWSLLLAGQMTSRGEAAYPLTDWSMYAASNPADPSFIDYTAELSGGREERLLIGRLFPVGGKRLRTRIDKAAYATERTQPGSDSLQAVENLDAMLSAVAREYNARHPGDTVRTIRMWSVTVPARNYRGPASISRRLLREYHAP